MKKFWQILDLLGKEGAPRLTWRNELGNSFPKFEGFLRPRQVVDSIRDPEFAGRILDLEEREDGDFDAFSREIPAHRRPFRVARADAVRLVPDIVTIADHIAPTLGFAASGIKPSRKGNFHELGALNLPRQQPRPVFLFVPGLTRIFHGSIILTAGEGRRRECGGFGRILALTVGFGHTAPYPRCFDGAGDSTVAASIRAESDDHGGEELLVGISTGEEQTNAACITQNDRADFEHFEPNGGNLGASQFGAA